MSKDNWGSIFAPVKGQFGKTFVQLNCPRIECSIFCTDYKASWVIFLKNVILGCKIKINLTLVHSPPWVRLSLKLLNCAQVALEKHLSHAVFLLWLECMISHPPLCSAHHFILNSFIAAAQYKDISWTNAEISHHGH